MASVIERAPAKLNLALHVRAREADGYHRLETLFAFATDGDVLTVAPADAWSLRITGPFAPALSAGPDNLVARAAAAFDARFGGGLGWAVTLDKRLPVASGIGGGSADAAAMLRVLARQHGVAPANPALLALAGELGADVPACLLGRTARGEGRGERLAPLPPLGQVAALLVNPGIGVSTAAVFARWDCVDRGALAVGDPLTVARAGRNDLEAPARGVAPQIGAVLTALDDGGAMLVRMSGSGATCFALYETVAQRDRAAVRIAVAEPGWWVLPTALA